MGLTTSNNTCWWRKEKSLYAITGHIRKSTISELSWVFGVCPHLLSLATVALWNALSCGARLARIAAFLMQISEFSIPWVHQFECKVTKNYSYLQIFLIISKMTGTSPQASKQKLVTLIACEITKIVWIWFIFFPKRLIRTRKFIIFALGRTEIP